MDDIVVPSDSEADVDSDSTEAPSDEAAAEIENILGHRQQIEPQRKIQAV